MEIDGIAHVMLTVRNMGASRPFYRRLLQHLGLTEVIDTADYLYFVGARTAVGLRPATRDRYGDRRAMIEDPRGNVWQIATRTRRG